MLGDLLLTLLLIALILAGMAAVYVAFSAVAAWRSRWTALARRFPASATPTVAEPKTVKRARIQGVIYKNIITVRVTDQGLHLRPWLLDRVAHRSVLIPWAAVTRVEAVPLAAYLAQATHPSAPFLQALLIRLGQKEISEGIASHPELSNIRVTVNLSEEDAIQLELLLEVSQLAEYVSVETSAPAPGAH